MIFQKEQNRIVALLRETFPDALRIRSSVEEPKLITVTMPNDVRIAMCLSQQHAGPPNGWVVYEGLAGDNTVLVNTPLIPGNWDDIVGFVSVARNICNKAAEASEKFREVLEGLQISTLISVR